MLLLCSCVPQSNQPSAPLATRSTSSARDKRASENSTRAGLPADVVMNAGAGRGDFLILMLRMENHAEELPFIVDTGAPGTLFDKSLASKLTRLPLGTWPVQTLSEKQESGIFLQPVLYLGDVRLMTGTLAATFDTKKLSSAVGRRIMGVLGMDCLRHYCLQLDFEARKLRFLDARQAVAAKAGKPFPLTFSFPGGQPSIEHTGLCGGKRRVSDVDTGFNLDGQIERGAIQGHDAGIVHLSKCVWDGDTYSDLTVAVGEDANRLGLRFLARHLVTLDFPNGMMYLRRKSIGPLVSDDVQAEGNAAARSALSFLKELMNDGRLPGWSASDEAATRDVAFEFDTPNIAICDELLKKGDPSIYHYKLVRASKERPWELKKAWRTDRSGHILEEYAVPGAVP